MSGDGVGVPEPEPEPELQVRVLVEVYELRQCMKSRRGADLRCTRPVGHP